MRDHQPVVWIPDSRKGKVGKLLENVKAVEKSRGSCLFVVGEDGSVCGNPVSINCHAIPEASVLGELKDSVSGKVLEFRWGVSKWQDHLVRGNASSPIDLDEMSAFDPQSVGAGDACVGRFACKDKVKGVDHDGEFGPIDVNEPDLTNPIVRLLSMYRATLYEVDMCRVVMQIAEGWNERARRHPDVGIRSKWNQLRSALNSRIGKATATASRLGKVWCARKNRGEANLDIVSEHSLYFHSRLKFAFSGFNVKGVVVLVVPVGDYRHKMSILHLYEDAGSVKEYKEGLIRLARASEDINNNGTEVVEGLMMDGWGIVAASPESYRELRDAEKQTMRRLIAGNLAVDTLINSLTSHRPQRRQRRR